jgi:hypothetical protein
MAKTITRQTLNLFGATGASTNFGKFGSQAAGAAVTTKAIATIQALAAYADGWQSAVALGNAPYLEDMNGLFYLTSYQQCYMLQEGVPEYDSGSTYYIGSLVKRTGTSEIYMSLSDANVGNALPTAGTSNASWQFIFGVISNVFRTGTPMAAGDGAVGAPGFTFSADPTTGFYRIGTGNMGVAASGVKIAEFKPTGTANNTTYNPFNIFGGVGNRQFGFHRQQTTGITTTAVKFISAPGDVNLILITGSGTTSFSDIIGYAYNHDPVVIASMQSSIATPPARTYTGFGFIGDVKLAMASGTFTIDAACLSW